MAKHQTHETTTQGALGRLLNAVTDLVPGKTATEDDDSTDGGPDGYAETLRRLAEEKRTAPTADPAHAPGHRKMGSEPTSSHAGGKTRTQSSALQDHARADIIHQTESEQRRIISGASIERKGRRD